VPIVAIGPDFRREEKEILYLSGHVVDITFETLRLRAEMFGVNYRCSLGTNTVLGLVTNRSLALLPDCGEEN
jgi:hypothetical protein